MTAAPRFALTTGMQRQAFTVFGYPIYWYALLIVTGIIGATVIGCLREKKKGLPPWTFIDFLLIAVIVGIVSARIYYCAFRWEDYKDNLLEVLRIHDGGLAIYGGILAGVATGVVFSRKRHISFGLLADLCAPGLALAQGIGRWGNFVNQEAYGVAVTSARWQFFPAAVFIEADETWHAATFFYESAWCLIVCAALLILERRRYFSKPGDMFGAYVFLYALERAIVEQLRTDSLYWGPLRVSQALSLIALLGIGACLLARCKRRGKDLLWFGAYAAAFALFLSAVVWGNPALQLPAACFLTAAAVAFYAHIKRLEARSE
ncbi:MAG: prolipoprotein diacylglyceryl transferase [Clostridia bacterium]|nr:prolipoprotein diacylglyceryl transferase [Clostridia bacterium]